MWHSGDICRGMMCLLHVVMKNMCRTCRLGSQQGLVLFLLWILNHLHELPHVQILNAACGEALQMAVSASSWFTQLMQATAHRRGVQLRRHPLLSSLPVPCGASSACSRLS